MNIPLAPKTPRHIAYIMDGNGRWAAAQGSPRIRGHERGAEVLREVTRFCCAEGVPEITFYALSTENYRSRPRREVRELMRLLREYLIGERGEIMEQNIRLRSIGRVDDLPGRVVRELRKTEKMSAVNDGMILRLALNYGSRGEILDAVKKIVAEVAAGRSPKEFRDLDERQFANYLYDPEMCDPDLLVRTAGEQRVSNFLLWQISYAEIWITEVPWPEFTVEHVADATAAYESRQRKFGSVISEMPEEPV